jgi:cell division septation protein DedD
MLKYAQLAIHFIQVIRLKSLTRVEELKNSKRNIKSKIMNKKFLIVLLVYACSTTTKLYITPASPEEFQPLPITFFTKTGTDTTVKSENKNGYSWKAEAVSGAFTYGYRIQILASANKKQIEKLKEELSKKGVNYPIYIKYVPPMYRLRVGDFQKYEDAQKALNYIKGLGYKDAFVTEDFISK